MPPASNLALPASLGAFLISGILLVIALAPPSFEWSPSYSDSRDRDAGHLEGAEEARLPSVRPING